MSALLTAMTNFVSIMSGGNVMHYQPKLVKISESIESPEGRGQRFDLHIFNV